MSVLGVGQGRGGVDRALLQLMVSMRSPSFWFFLVDCSLGREWGEAEAASSGCTFASGLSNVSRAQMLKQKQKLKKTISHFWMKNNINLFVIEWKGIKSYEITLKSK